MDKQEVFLKLVGKINEQKKEQEAGKEIEFSSNIQEIGLNSIDFIKILIFIEDEFEIEFDDNDLIMEKYEVMADIVDLVCLYMTKEQPCL
jgi:acyl carrier protein